jgi:hypothetical protein
MRWSVMPMEAIDPRVTAVHYERKWFVLMDE